MSDEAAMPADVRARCKKLRRAAKLGLALNADDLRFVHDCWKRYPDEYRDIGHEVFEETKPFGSVR